MTDLEQRLAALSTGDLAEGADTASLLELDQEKEHVQPEKEKKIQERKLFRLAFTISDASKALAKKVHKVFGWYVEHSRPFRFKQTRHGKSW